MSGQTHSDEQWAELCSKTKDLVPVEVGKEAWYLIIASALITSPSPELLGEFSSYLTRSHPDFSDDQARSKLSQRLRDVCLKLMTIVGAPTVLSGLMPLAQAEGDVAARSERSQLSEKWNEVDMREMYKRGEQTILSIYDSHFLPKIFARWGLHKEDVAFHEIAVVYGIYLADNEVMTAIESEAVVFASITCQAFRGPGLWHIRGMGRVLGARGKEGDSTETDNALSIVKDQLRNMKVALINVVEFVGDEYVRRARLDSWCNVGDVQRELGGWGEDE